MNLIAKCLTQREAETAITKHKKRNPRAKDNYFIDFAFGWFEVYYME
jgi:hypothetical protein